MKPIFFLVKIVYKLCQIKNKANLVLSHDLPIMSSAYVHLGYFENFIKLYLKSEKTTKQYQIKMLRTTKLCFPLPPPLELNNREAASYFFLFIHSALKQNIDLTPITSEHNGEQYSSLGPATKDVFHNIDWHVGPNDIPWNLSIDLVVKTYLWWNIIQHRYQMVLYMARASHHRTNRGASNMSQGTRGFDLYMTKILPILWHKFRRT